MTANVVVYMSKLNRWSSYSLPKEGPREENKILIPRHGRSVIPLLAWNQWAEEAECGQMTTLSACWKCFSKMTPCLTSTEVLEHCEVLHIGTSLGNFVWKTDRLLPAHNWESTFITWDRSTLAWKRRRGKATGSLHPIWNNMRRREGNVKYIHDHWAHSIFCLMTCPSKLPKWRTVPSELPYIFTRTLTRYL